MERALEDPWRITGARLLGAEWMPRVEVTESDKEVVVKAELPGLDKKDIHVSVSEDAVTIRGVKTVSRIPEEPGSGRQAGGDVEETQERELTFYRSLSLPATVRPQEARAASRTVF